MRLIKDVSITLIGKIILLFIGIISSIIVARYLGPSGKGIFAVLGVISGIALQFGNLGIPAANIYFIGKEKNLLSQITANSFFFGIGGGIVVAIVVYLLFILCPDIIGKINPFFLIVTLMSLPFVFMTLLYTNILLGCQRFFGYNLINIFGGVFSLVVNNIILLVILKKGIVELVIMSTITTIIFSLVYIIYVYRLAKFKTSFDLTLFHRMIKYGIKSYIASLLGYLIIRSDIFLVNYFLGVGSTGIYSVAVGFADLLYMLPASVGMILFPKISGTQDDKGILTQIVCRYTVLMMIILCLTTGIISKPLILLLYGSQFHSSIVPFLWLLPGIFSLGIGTILMQDLAGRGLPPIVYIAPSIALFVNLILNIVLIPVIHINGASISSSISYTIMMGLTMRYFLGLTNSSLSDVLVIKRKDLSILKDTITKGLLSKEVR